MICVFEKCNSILYNIVDFICWIIMTLSDSIFHWRQTCLLRSKANRQRRACSLDSCLSCSFLDSTVESDAIGQLAGLS